ncbi:hypothetical protein [Acinetobacter towneri]|uniref:hypothetical protein n=1 Tax=Acinetobacter towneri TaxID=202956 RepID=UPI002097F4E2|nr:hypothetical protein [Acinetobacter towneri]MCO8058090.1 hypothetical protein [Acinetobacter towneri]MCO8063736.1 hypothetical protein [Acinetobacter towneri]
MKKEDEQNKGPIKLGTLTPELLKSLSGQVVNNEDGFKELQRLSLERARQLEALAKHSKGPRADEYWQPQPEVIKPHPHQIKEEYAELSKGLKPVDFNFLELKLNQIKELPTDELLKLLSGESHSGLIRESTIQLISNEILSRQIKEASKPHWTVYLGVVLAFIAAITGIIQLIK